VEVRQTDKDKVKIRKRLIRKTKHKEDDELREEVS